MGYDGLRCSLISLFTDEAGRGCGHRGRGAENHPRPRRLPNQRSGLHCHLCLLPPRPRSRSRTRKKKQRAREKKQKLHLVSHHTHLRRLASPRLPSPRRRPPSLGRNPRCTARRSRIRAIRPRERAAAVAASAAAAAGARSDPREARRRIRRADREGAAARPARHWFGSIRRCPDCWLE